MADSEEGEAEAEGEGDGDKEDDETGDCSKDEDKEDAVEEVDGEESAGEGKERDQSLRNEFLSDASAELEGARAASGGDDSTVLLGDSDSGASRCSFISCNICTKRSRRSNTSSSCSQACW